MANSTSPGLCPDWVFVTSSNVHVAKDRAWFKTYTPFESKVGNPYTGDEDPDQGVRVAGIGTVELSVKRSPHHSGASSHNTLCLKEVLHCPDAICNIIGTSLSFHGYNVRMQRDTKTHGSISDGNGKAVAYFDPKKQFFTLKLSGPPRGPSLGPSPFVEGTAYLLGLLWSDREQKRWQEFKSANKVSEPHDHEESGTADVPPYTTDERNYLKRNWGGEFRFLIQHGLSINKEEHRAEARSMLRSLMQEDEFNETSEEDGLGESSEEDEMDLEGHQADYNFTERQLNWIEKHYRNSHNFMFCHGLKFYDDDDLKVAKAIAQTLSDDSGAAEGSNTVQIICDEVRFFTESELKWIRKHHSTSKHFMSAFELKPSIAEDVQKAKIFAKVSSKEWEQARQRDTDELLRKWDQFVDKYGEEPNVRRNGL